MEEISRASAGIGLSYGAHSNLCINQADRAVSQQHPNRDSDTHPPPRALSFGAAYSRKCRWRSCNVRTDSSRKVTAFLVEKGMDGLARGNKLDKLGMRCSETCELFFDNIHIPPENILGTPGEGAKVLMSGLDSERLVLAGGPLGIMAACLDVVFPYINHRQQFGQPVADFQLMQGKLADAYTIFISHRAFLYSVARAYSEGSAGRADCAAAILCCAEKATHVALDTIQMLGGNG
ncbi:putative isovaleryl-coA dehydrogenase [Neospora caninum Liverpool]|uniref:Isovaleryl-coA dehydrogenase, putative n=1 Tax=Neospora caninum (strain Liverpool) TaxID=572307 RepID=F0VEU6_NEOCL|nr:putative isovaleryl-coA dehydrogenase [Neospora caninum Liverpool]CBZ52240.1 putative isovaleryl-coA dehydrogenase [Neospora caninum Liverpool]CEL66208.1 TPA: isovaleryl-coA dehydrogenase, putative [Neospora caninum Liverpool]|eukprot:XP_003882272.1 putative isovaleryl-coA dehydrogenase [Neospora caninum Liverpool]